MRIFPPPLDIGEEEGFSPDKDIFGRSKLGTGLLNLVGSVSDPMVIAVDGQWGSGKTTFLKMWAGELRKADFPVVYFDAFESDCLDDAFMAIAGEIISLAQDKKKEKSPKAKRFVDSAVGASKVLMRSGLKLGVKVATLGAIAAADIEEMGEDIAKEAGNLTDKYLGDLLTKQKEMKQSIGQFREALSQLPELLTDIDKGADGSNPTAVRPLIFIIDELDRCRPSFALEILERTKHFFAVTNVHFVLGVHIGQLHNSVLMAYGPNIDAQMYLQKFIHLTFHLIERERFPDDRTIRKYVKFLGERLDIKDEDHEAASQAIEFIKIIAERKNLSLRTIEKVMTYLAIALAYTKQSFLRPGPIVGGLCLLKVIDPNAYASAKRGNLSFKTVKMAFEFQPDDPEWYCQFWEFCTNETASQELIQDFGRGLSKYRIDDRFEIIPLLVDQILDRLTPAESQ